jgi:hypothetical protein
MHESLQGASFHIEHVIPQSRGGESAAANLALACPGCNLHKGARTAAKDPSTGEWVQFFDPIHQEWSQHLRFRHCEVEGLTPIGRAAVAALDLNHSRRQRIRQVEEAFDLYPPTD